MKKYYTIILSLFSVLFVSAQPADENFDDDANQTYSGDNFNFDGVRYIITPSGPYSHAVLNNPAFSPLGNGAGDYFLFFDQDGFFGISSIRIEATSGAAFKLSGLSIDAIADGNVTITPSGGAALSYSSNGTYITVENINTSANPNFQNITSVTIAGANISLAIDDLNFEPVIVLPLGLTDFSAQVTGVKTQLNWQTSQEINMYQYTIERSSDMLHWHQLYSMQARNTPEKNNYSYTHIEPEISTVFYRLKMQDKDGKYRYSDILQVNYGRLSKLSIYPNPAKDMINIVLGDVKTANLQLINGTGQVILQKILSGNVTGINIRSLIRGPYTVKIIQGNTVYVHTLIKD